MNVIFDKVLGKLRENSVTVTEAPIDGSSYARKDAAWIALSTTPYPQVTDYASLPAAAGVAGKIYIVLTGTGIWPFTRKPAGMYYSDGAAWSYMSAYPDLLKDGNFGIQNTADPTKVVNFSAAGILTGTARVFAFPDANGTLSLVGHTQNASTVIIPNGVGTPAYSSVQDYLQATRSAGRITGGVLTAHAGPNGTVDISEMEGMIFTTNALAGNFIFFKQPAATAGLALTDLSVNFVYLDWNGGTPQYLATTDRTTVNQYNQFIVGRCFRSGTSVEVQIATGFSVFNLQRRAQDRLITKYGNMDRVSGATVSQHATALRIQTDAGVFYSGNNQFTTTAANTFKVWYRTGGGAWTRSVSLTLFSAIFDGAAATVFTSFQNGTSIGTLTNNNHYGVYWIYLCPDGDLYVVMGDASYANIGLAQAAAIPASLPPYCVNYAKLIGKVICKKSAVALYSVESAFVSTFTLSSAVDHASLFNLAYADSGHTGFVASGGVAGGQTIIGGTGTTDDLILRTTAGIGTTGADMIFQVGNNGATEAVRILNDGNVKIGGAITNGLGRIQIKGADVQKIMFGNTDWNVSSAGSGSIFYNGSASGDTYSAWQAYKTGGAYADILLNPTSGKVGIGIEPSTKLHVYGDNANTGGLRVSRGASDANQWIDIYSAGGQNILASTRINAVLASGLDTLLNNVGSDGTRNNITILGASGNVGIGETVPLTNLHISGANGAINSVGNAFIVTKDDYAIDKGGQITLGGKYRSSGLVSGFGAIAARKENAADVNSAGYLQFSTQDASTGMNEWLRITSDGRIYGKALHNNAGSVTGAANQYIASGTYTPGLNVVTNIRAAAAYACQWMRVGNVVTVSGQIDIGLTTGGIASALAVNLPIASTFTLYSQLGGVATSSGTSGAWTIVPDVPASRIMFQTNSIPLNTTYSYWFTFTYLIL